MTDITADQAVELTLVSSGAWVPAAMRPVPLIYGRGMLLRALWKTDPGFVARTIVGRLTLKQMGGATAQHDAQVMVSGAPDLTKLDGTFSWIVDPAEITAQTEFSVELFETSRGGGGAAQDHMPRFPASGTQALEPWPNKMIVNVVVVPLKTDCPSGPGNQEPNLTDAIKEQLRNYTFNLYPVQALNVEFHSVLQVKSTDCPNVMADEDPMGPLSDLRAKEKRGNGWYYQGISQAGGGYSYLSGPEPTADRIGWTGVFSKEPILNFPHELGHTHGQSHTYNDANYVPKGGLGRNGNAIGLRDTWGFALKGSVHPGYPGNTDILHMLIKPSVGPGMPPDRGEDIGLTMPGILDDIMGYSQPYWVSAYTYRAFAERVKIVSGYAARDSSPPPGSLLAGVVYRDGHVRWRVAPNRATSAQRDAAQYARLVTRGGARDLPVAYEVGPDGKVGGLFIPLGEDLTTADLTSFEVHAAGQALAGTFDHFD